MPRATNSPASRKKRKRTLKKTRGYFGNKSRLYRYAKDAFMRAGAFAFRDRKRKKSAYRSLWIVRLNAAVRPFGLSYSRFMNGVIKAGIQLDRKMLSEMAIHDAPGFAKIVDLAKQSLAAASKVA